jgi:transposase-like protein
VLLHYPADIRRRIDHRWRTRAAAAATRSAAAISAAALSGSAATCPLCREPAAIAHRHRSGAAIRAHWLCAPCGAVWTTTPRLAG